MGYRPKIDLKNGHVGGQPKDWLDRAVESGQDDWWQDVKMAGGLLLLALIFVVSIGSVLYALLKFAGKF